MKKLLIIIGCIAASGCVQSQSQNVRVVRTERLGVVMEMSAPKEVIVNDQYELTNMIREK